MTFTVFTALALALAVPYVLLTLVPGWANRLPRPGRWMETLKHITAIPLFLTTVWLIWVYGRSRGDAPSESSDHIARLLVGLVVLAIAGWTLERWPARRRGYLTALLLAVAGFGIPLSGSHSDKLQWQRFPTQR